MNRIPPDTQFTVTLDDLPVCGVSNRLQQRINRQFALVAVVMGAVIGVAVAIVARLAK